HVEYRAAATLDHAGNEPAAQVDDGRDVDLDDVEFFLHNAFRDGSNRRQAGVVDQDVDGHTELRYPGGQCGAVRPLGKVGRQRVGAAAEVLGARVENLGSPRDQDQAVAAACEFASDRFTDARRRAGDQRGAVLCGCWKSHSYDRSVDGRRRTGLLDVG